MNLNKKLATLILGMAALATFACQYTHVNDNPPYAYGDGYDLLVRRRYFYLSGINTPGNHIPSVTVTSDSHYDFILNWTAYNYQTVSLPLTVYVGVADIYGSDSYNYQFPAGRELEEITIVAQYRVMPESSWHTAATKKFAYGSVSALSQKKIFGDLKIDCEAAPGSTVLVRIWIAVNTVWHFTEYNAHNGTDRLYTPTLPNTFGELWRYCSRYLENADIESPGVTNISEVKAEEQHRTYAGFRGYDSQGNLSGGMYCRLSPGLHMMGDEGSYSINLIPKYADGWTPQFVMAVTIGNKRRPGK